MNLSCYFGTATCEGATWTCQTCGESYCTHHSNQTSNGLNVECAACENDQASAVALAAIRAGAEANAGVANRPGQVETAVSL